MRTRGFAGTLSQSVAPMLERNPRSEEFFPMKNYLLSLSLAAAMAVPAVAQQNQQTTPDQSQASQTQQAQSSNDQTATGKDPLTYQRKEGFWGHLNPFARKKYVNR